MSSSHTISTAPPTTLLVSVDHRPTISLNGDWHTIVDPYFHGKARTYGYFMNGKQEPDGKPVEYDFQNSPVLHVPRDWNTQRESLLFYEGPMWYQRDFSYQCKPGTRVFFHVGAANYRSYVWVNGQKVCEHEGGFTPFDCEVTDLLKDGGSFVVIAVDNTRLANGIPTLQTDWWNYGGLTRDVSLVEVPEQFIDDFDLHLKRGTQTVIEGWVHVVGAAPEAFTTVSIPELNVNEAAEVGTDGRATFQFEASNLEPWSPEHPRLQGRHDRQGGVRAPRTGSNTTDFQIPQELPLNVAVRSRARGRLRFFFNYGPEPITLHLPPETRFCLGGPELPIAGVAAIEQEEE